MRAWRPDARQPGLCGAASSGVRRGAGSAYDNSAAADSLHGSSRTINAFCRTNCYSRQSSASARCVWTAMTGCPITS